jgi:predicted alpha/beta superfamily hydrolase
VKNLLFVTLTLIVAVSCNSPKEEKTAQKYENIIAKYTEIKEIQSREVDDTFYVYVRLPKNYLENTNKRYPVLYLLDGDIAFNMATSIVLYLQYGKDIPEIIIVGIGYGTMLNDIEQNFRERDYTISQFERFKSSGGGVNFTKFLDNELFPLVNSSYRTCGLNIFNGYSLGGLFVLNTLISNSNLFNYYIAGSPYLINDIDSLIKKASQLTKFDESKKLFISVGETEGQNEYKNPIQKITERLKQIENLELSFVEFENGTHFTCPPEALTYGLKFIFSGNNNMEIKL